MSTHAVKTDYRQYSSLFIVIHLAGTLDLHYTTLIPEDNKKDSSVIKVKKTLVKKSLQYSFRRDWTSTNTETEYQIKSSLCESGAEVRREKEDSSALFCVVFPAYFIIPSSILVWDVPVAAFPVHSPSVKYDVHTCRDHIEIRHLKYPHAKLTDLLTLAAPPATDQSEKPKAHLGLPALSNRKLLL